MHRVCCEYQEEAGVFICCADVGLELLQVFFSFKLKLSSVVIRT